MTDQNIRFREASLPRDVKRIPKMPPKSIFEYKGTLYCMAMWWSIYTGEFSYPLIKHQTLTSFEWPLAGKSLEPQIHRAAQMWSQGGYGDMSLAEFLNETVPL